MAPEFYTGENPTYDKSVDVFAMGMLFLTMIKAEKGKPLLSPKTGKFHSYTCSAQKVFNLLGTNKWRTFSPTTDI